MTATPGSGAPTPVFPPGRYGRRRDPVRQRRRQWIVWFMAAVVGLAGVGIAVKLYRQYAEAPYQARIITVTGLSDTAVTVTFEVTKPPGASATCTMLAHTRDGLEVGRAEIDVAATAPPVSRVTYTLTTTQRPVTGEVPGCGPGPSEE